ncbi:unnamed protein product [Somion occarium]|uniref:DUF4145 domain-containing protein n=1 Tax=Somion occarium TaxID=3059160 RepID=A0ABP1E383_9APHY
MNILRYWMEPLELLRHLSLEHSRRGPMDRTIASWHLKIKLKKKSCWGICVNAGKPPTSIQVPPSTLKILREVGDTVAHGCICSWHDLFAVLGISTRSMRELAEVARAD